MSRIRTATEADLPAVTAIYNQAVLETTATFDLEPRSLEDRRRWLNERDPRHPVLVAEEAGEVVGYASLGPWNRKAAYADTAETSMYVAAPHRGRGVGRALKVALIERARELGMHALIAGVAEGSEASLHLNLSLGFEHVGTLRQVGEKFGRRLDVHLLQLVLED
jgi:phosphinothricin acetyltransferase